MFTPRREDVNLLEATQLEYDGRTGKVTQHFRLLAAHAENLEFGSQYPQGVTHIHL